MTINAISADKAAGPLSSRHEPADVLLGLDTGKKSIPKLPHRRWAQHKHQFETCTWSAEGAPGGRATHDVVGLTPSNFEPKGVDRAFDGRFGVWAPGSIGETDRRLKYTLKEPRQCSKPHDLAIRKAAPRDLG